MKTDNASERYLERLLSAQCSFLQSRPCRRRRLRVVSGHSPELNLKRSDAAATLPGNDCNATCCCRWSSTWRPAAQSSFRRLPRSERMSASEKADVEWCGAADRGRPTATDQVAPGLQRLRNRSGHSPAGQSRCQDARNCRAGQMALLRLIAVLISILGRRWVLLRVVRCLPSAAGLGHSMCLSGQASEKP